MHYEMTTERLHCSNKPKRQTNANKQSAKNCWCNALSHKHTRSERAESKRYIPFIFDEQKIPWANKRACNAIDIQTNINTATGFGMPSCGPSGNDIREVLPSVHAYTSIQVCSRVSVLCIGLERTK